MQIYYTPSRTEKALINWSGQEVGVVKSSWVWSKQFMNVAKDNLWVWQVNKYFYSV